MVASVNIDPVPIALALWRLSWARRRGLARVWAKVTHCANVAIHDG